GEPRPGGARLERLLGFRHQLGPQVVAEVWVERGRGRPGRLEEVNHLAVGRVGEELFQLGIVHQVNSTSSCGSSRRSRSTPRWSSSLTAPELFPRITAISSIFRSSPNFNTMAARCWRGSWSIADQTRRLRARRSTSSTTLGPPLGTLAPSSRSTSPCWPR